MKPWMKYGLAGVVGFALAAAGSSGSGKTKTVTQVAAADRATPTVTVTTPARTVTVTHVRVKRVAAQPVAPKPSTPTSAAAGQSYSGNGSRTYSIIHVPADSVMQWTNDGGLFSIIDANFGNSLDVSSQGSSGETDAPAGDYKRVQVIADGNWTMKFVPKG